jgi:hypothetical protein
MARSPNDDKAKDVLAAEAFAVPAADPWLHRGHITLPADPTGIEEPHDVLAAEAFALPAPPYAGVSGALVRRAGSSWRIGAGAAVGVLLALVVLRLLRRR